MTRVIGLIGRIGSGKTVVADYLVREGNASYLRFSDVLRDMLVRLHKPETRENLQNLGLALRKAYGDDVLAEVLREDISSLGSGLVVVDGIRYRGEFDMIRSLGGRIVFVKASQETRYGRTALRGTRGEARISLEEFRRNDSRGTEEAVDELGREADVVIENEGTVEELASKAAKLLKP